MLEKLYNAIRKDAAPTIINIDDRDYSDKPLHRVEAPTPQVLNVSSLTGFVDYVSKNLDGLDHEKLFVHVFAPDSVILRGPLLQPFLNRTDYIAATYRFFSFSYGQWIASEDFIIGLQALFANSGDKKEVLSYLSSITDLAEAVYDDSGISQGETTRRSVSSKETKILPNPVNLAPFRTFSEVEQPLSPFIFRVRKGASGLEYMLAEADGGAWRNAAMQNIKAYLEWKLPEIPVIA